MSALKRASRQDTQPTEWELPVHLGRVLVERVEICPVEIRHVHKKRGRGAWWLETRWQGQAESRARAESWRWL